MAKKFILTVEITTSRYCTSDEVQRFVEGLISFGVEEQEDALCRSKRDYKELDYKVSEAREEGEI